MDRMKELIMLIKKYDKAYEGGHPLISDTEYDKLYTELIELEKKYGQDIDSPTNYIEDAKINHLKKVVHTSPMLSQEKCHTKEEIERFVERTQDSKYVVDLKLDGISIALKYVDGKLTQAVTRGNGHYGYDITAAALNMDCVPKKLLEPMTIEVRGEVIMNEDDFESLNGNGEYSNSRNFVAGTLNALDISLVRQRKLYVCCYDIRSINNELGQHMSTIDAHELLKKLGFMTVKYWSFSKNEISKMTKFCENFNTTIRPTIECKIDGLVIKSNNEKIIEELGNTSKFPKSSIAFKFDSQDRTTILRNVEWQVGRTGQITPVAVFDEIEIDGVKINKASLANIDNIRKLDIYINDTIVVARSNDVIPKVISVIKEKRTKPIEIKRPTNCPVCNHGILKNGPLLFCINSGCESQIVSKLSHFASRDAMNIEDLSDKTIKAIRDAGIPLRQFGDIYLLNKYKDELLKIDRFGGKKVDNLLTEINKINTKYLHQFIYGLSIPNVGLSKAKAIASQYENLNDLILAVTSGTFESTIRKLSDFGDIIVSDIMRWLDIKENQDILLMFNRIWTFPSEKKTVVTSKLSGKIVVITGELSVSRKEMTEYLENFGIKVSSSISSKTDYVLVGDNNQETTSSKYQKALSLGIEIIEESKFKKLLK